MKKTLLLLSSLAFLQVTMAQQKNYWSSHKGTENIIKDKSVSRLSFPKAFKLFDLNISDLRQELFSVVDNSTRHTAVISLPNADGQMEAFEVVEASNFEPALQARFPEIRSFSGKGLTDKYATLKLSISPQGIQTMTFRVDKENEFIEAYSQDHTVYAVFTAQRQAGQLPWTCNTQDRILADGINTLVLNSGITARSGGDLKTMRLAQSVTAEYSNYFGATSSSQASLVLTAVNNTLTRCNGVYEKDLALHLNLISNTTSVFYYSPSTDPYDPASTGAGGTWNAQLQNTLNTVIGSANYDIGHLFGQSGGGGNAGCIGCVCVNSTKGSGFTSPADGIPSGDNFDIDYVVHEVGHQLGGNHTFSMSNEGTGVNVEPGSGITIMGYAGITSQDLAPHSIAIYHAATIGQIQTNLASKTCPVTTSISANNATPVVATVPNYTIPISTPFALTGSATDANGDALTYCWEQNDNASSAQTNASSVASATKSSGPNWISFLPTTSPTRYFPKLATILSGGLISGPLTGGDAGANTEALSSVGRTLKFRLTVRDNCPYSSTAPVKVGQTQFTEMTVTVSAASGPFSVTSPNTAVSWAGGSTQNITWNVANTTATPVSCANVKISLSTDGGQTFPTVLAASTPNDGTEALVIPNTASTTARIKVEAVGNIFFDISNTNFTITAGTTCSTPTGLTSSSVTTSSATVNWTAVSGASSYAVDYKLNSSATWVSFSTAQTTTSASLSGLTSGSLYDWRVKTNCTSGSSAYASAQFTTTSTATCSVPSGLTTSAITSSGATLGWTAVSGATGYNVQYRAVGAASWIAATTATNSLVLNTLTASTNYEFQAQTVCSATLTSAFSASATFTTSAAGTCSNNFEPNNTSATATALTQNSAVSSQINAATDVDWYSFTTATPNTNVKIALSALPADYDVTLYNSALTSLGSSVNAGTTAEQIIYNTATAGTYYVQVGGFKSASLANYNFTAGTAAAATTATKLTIGSLVQGNNNGTTTLITNASASSGYTGASGTYNAGAAARTGVLNTAASGSAYFEFTVTPSTGNAVTLTGISFGSRSTSTGPLAYALRSSIDGYASNLATGTLTNTSAWALFSNSGLSVSGAVGAAVTFRIYGYNGTGTASAGTANWRIDDLNLTGSVNGFNNTQCYTLTANTGSTTFRQATPVARSPFSIYPNPAQHEISVQVSESIDNNAILMIYDAKGVLVRQQRLTNNKQKFKISNLTSGFYYIKVNNGGQILTEKFIKQ